MENKFDRIIREPLVMGGQARIRDTNITVNEIVCLSLEGISQADILREYPQLDAEDLHQACGYSMSHTIDIIARYRSEVLETITPIVAYSAILIGKTPLPFKQEDVTTFTELIFYNGHHAKARVYALGAWTNSNFKRSRDDESESYVLSEIVEEAIQEALDHKSNAEIQHNTEGLQASVVIKSFLARALAYLLIGGYDFDHTAELYIEISEQVAKFIITRQLLEYVSDFKFSYGEHDYGGLLDIANLIIYQNNTELKYRQNGKNVIFEFELPIWKDEQD